MSKEYRQKQKHQKVALHASTSPDGGNADQDLKSMSESMRFPYFSRPLGPLLAKDERELYEARSIRRRVLQMMHEEANATLSEGNRSGDDYHGYLVYLAYLRTMFWADDWLKLRDVKDSLDVLVIIAEGLDSVLPMIPSTEQACYEQEQSAIQMILNDPDMNAVIRYIDSDPIK